MAYIIDGVYVSFAHRDIAQATDDEIERIKILVGAEKRLAETDAHRHLDEMIIESDRVDWDMRYRLTTRVIDETIDPVDQADSPSNP